MDEPQCLWTIREAANGHGLFAAADIKAGLLIIQEAPLLTVSRQEAQSASEHIGIPVKTGLLSSEDQDRLMDLYHNPSKLREFAEYQGHPCPGAPHIDSAVALAKFYTNAATITAGDLDAGLFPTFCRMNHSCGPNTSWGYDEVSGTMQVYASRSVRQGEELTDAYTELARPRARRAKELANWGFQCECLVCQGPEAEEHEARRRQVWRTGELLKLYDAHKKGNEKDRPIFAEMPKTDAEALKLAEESAALLEVEGLVEELGAAYGRCAKFARAAGLLKLADDYEEKEFEILVLTTGECSPSGVGAKDVLERSHIESVAELPGVGDGHEDHHNMTYIQMDMPEISCSADDNAAIDQFVRKRISTPWHSVGTCKMAPVA